VDSDRSQAHVRSSTKRPLASGQRKVAARRNASARSAAGVAKGLEPASRVLESLAHRGAVRGFGAHALASHRIEYRVHWHKDRTFVMTETYIQHNPNIATGRKAFVENFSRLRKPIPIEPKVKAGLVAIMAEGDLVMLVLRREQAEPTDPSKKYSYTAFDLFRVENGRIAEHWDAAMKRAPPSQPTPSGQSR
jgi:predicted SnoaL-like aldol condensation-catalyzing enzyme